MSYMNRLAVHAFINNPPLLADLVKRTGLSRRYVASELRRFELWLTDGPVRGRLSISYRVIDAMEDMREEASTDEDPETNFYLLCLSASSDSLSQEAAVLLADRRELIDERNRVLSEAFGPQTVSVVMEPVL
jgi:hypothetical protein